MLAEDLLVDRRCSMRSTISTACCSSTIISKLKRDRVIKKFIKIAKHAADAPARI